MFKEIKQCQGTFLGIGTLPLLLLLNCWNCLWPTVISTPQAISVHHSEATGGQGLLSVGSLHTATLFQQEGEFNTVDAGQLASELSFYLRLLSGTETSGVKWPASVLLNTPSLQSSCIHVAYQDGFLAHATSHIMPEDCLRKR